MARKTRWAVAGTGGITARTLPDLALTENLEVVAVSSRTQPRADTFASEFGIPRSYGAYQAMLADPDVDVVYICTPNGSHFAMAAQAVRAGKHILCEKPLTVNAAQARRLADLAREHNVFAMEAMWMKFNPAVQRLREIVEAGTIGAVRHITTGMGFPAPAAAGRFWSAEQGGGALLDLGVYVITFAEMFLAEAGEVTVQSGWTEHPAHPLSATIRTLELIDEVRRRLLDTHYPARGALDPWDSIPELPLDVRT